GRACANPEHPAGVAGWSRTRIRARSTAWDRQWRNFWFKDVAGAFVETAVSPAQVRHLLDRAFRIAQAERAVTCIIVPNELQREEAVAQPPHEHGAGHSGTGWTPPRVLPSDEDLRRAAEVLNAGTKVAMLVGAGAL